MAEPAQREPVWSDYGVALLTSLLLGPVIGLLCLVMGVVLMAAFPFLALANPVRIVDDILGRRQHDGTD